MNGRTGAVSGERPWSAIKIAIALVLALLVAAAVGYVVAENQGNGAPVEFTPFES